MDRGREASVAHCDESDACFRRHLGCVGTDDAAARSSVEQGATEMDQTDLSGPQPEGLVAPEVQIPVPARFEILGPARTFYFDRDKIGRHHQRGVGARRFLHWRSGYLADFLRFGATAYTSQPLYAPDDKDGTLLLQPGQEGYTVLGQWYGEFKFTDNISGAIGAKEYNTPYINKNDVRMTPNTFEGATLYGTAGGTTARPSGGSEAATSRRSRQKTPTSSSGCPKPPAPPVDRGVYGHRAQT